MATQCYVPARCARLLVLAAIVVGCAGNLFAQSSSPRRLIAHVVALDQPYMFNRLGAAQPAGMIYALLRDVVAIDSRLPIAPGNARLRDGKRPRPIVLRMNIGDTLTIYFRNLLLPYSVLDSSLKIYPYGLPISQGWLVKGSTTMPATRAAGVHVMGMQMGRTIRDDGSAVGANQSSLVASGLSAVYTIIATAEGCYLLYSTGADMGGTFNAGQLQQGLFGSINVEPAGAEYYRSQVTRADLLASAKSWADSTGKQDSVGAGLPIMNYQATYASGPFSGAPILNMVQSAGKDSLEIIYSDLTAIITGPGAGAFPQGSKDPTFSPNPAYPNRLQPYREFSIHYHEPKNAVQAFPVFYSSLSSTVSAGNDNFGINLGTGGIGAEVYANRIGVGPMANCVDCAYEEFFLSSWAVGDPAMVVDVPANATGTTIGSADTTLTQMMIDGIKGKDSLIPVPFKGFKATKAYYPDDPSNVYHSYLADHVKFRIHHAGSGVTHVHHQHAHQWLRSPNSDESEYLDSQILNPGTSFTLDIAYYGSGNKNLTVGDQIFHCHFYPHFAMGMWGLWRVHDVFESGTALDGNGRPIAGSRALPDAEIMTGTPIPAIVPMPTLPMAPAPVAVSIDNTNGQVIVSDTTGNPGFPFYIPGVAGSRAPHPPMDFAYDTLYDQNGQKSGFGPLDGGLPRHIVVGGKVVFHNETQFDWTKIFDSLVAIQLPDKGTPVEWAAMRAHAVRNHTSITPSGSSGTFLLNGRPPVPGAPYADPAVNMNGDSVGTKRVYKGAAIQMDVVLNKEGWHYPQQRMLTLWNDVSPTVSGSRPPQPLFFRANSNEFIEFWHTNLVPEYYELDNFQVRTPTDIIGQHIHLVKFDVTASDGAANGYNYEDGTFSPDQVRARIAAINNGRLYTYRYVPSEPVSDTAADQRSTSKLQAKYPNPIWGAPPSYNDQSWLGAQTTIQRWYADPLLSNDSVDRTIRTVFTHDHFGPSTHQQVGLYAGLLIEPKGSTWLDPVTGQQMGSRSDGGPTSWQANIIGGNRNNSYREFALEFQDLQLAYMAQSISTFVPYPVWNPKDSAAFADSVANNYTGWRDNSAIGPDDAGGTPYSRLVSMDGVGTYSLNYRNEPLPLRISTPTTSSTVSQASGSRGDLSYAYSSAVQRVDTHFNRQPGSGAPINPLNQSGFTFPKNPLTPGLYGTDPYTPMLRAYEGDSIQIRTLVGAHLVAHSFSLRGNRWLFEPALPNSGYRSTQEMSLSEHFELFFKLPQTYRTTTGPAIDSAFADYLYQASADMSGQVNGLWGLMRAYPTTTTLSDLQPLPNNAIGKSTANQNQGCGCPTGAPVRQYTVVAATANMALENTQFNPAKGKLVYNVSSLGGVLGDPNALILFNRNDLDSLPGMAWRYSKNAPVEPLVLRARAGECIKVTLVNGFKPGATDSAVFANQTAIVGGGVIWGTESQPDLTYNASPSFNIGLSPQLLSYNIRSDDGENVGFSTTQTVAPGQRRTYTWYAGTWKSTGTGFTAVPVEFGTINLASSDPLLQPAFGLFGSLIVEPAGSTWRVDSNSAASANVYASASDSINNKVMFREFVAALQNNTPNLTDPIIKAAMSAVNYKSATVGVRLPPNQTSTVNRSSKLTLVDVSQILLDTLHQSDTIVRIQPPQTPTYVAIAGTPVRMRVLRPYANGTDAVFELHGHVWQEEPYTDSSTVIGVNPMSQWQGSRGQLITLNGYEIVLPSAGGLAKAPGDYLYRTYGGNEFVGGLWGRMKVTSPSAPDVVTITAADPNALRLEGANLVNPRTGAFASNVSISVRRNGRTTMLATVPVHPDNGTWTLDGKTLKGGAQTLLQQALDSKAVLLVQSASGGREDYTPEELEEIVQSTIELERGKQKRIPLAPLTAPARRQPLQPGEKPSLSGGANGGGS